MSTIDNDKTQRPSLEEIFGDAPTNYSSQSRPTLDKSFGDTSTESVSQSRPSLEEIFGDIHTVDSTSSPKEYEMLVETPDPSNQVPLTTAKPENKMESLPTSSFLGDEQQVAKVVAESEKKQQQREHFSKLANDEEYRDDYFRGLGYKNADDYRKKTADRLETVLNAIKSNTPDSRFVDYAVYEHSMPVRPMEETVATRQANKVQEAINTLRSNNFWRGLAEGFDLADIATLGFAQLGDNAMVISALNKANKGEELTQTERSLVDAWKLGQQVEGEISMLGGRSLGANIGSGLAQSMPFVAEMLATGGVAAAATKGISKAIAKKGIQEAAETYVRAGAQNMVKKKGAEQIVEGLEKAGLHLAESAIGNAVRVPLTGGVYKNYTGKRLEQFATEDGKIQKYATPAWKDAMKAGFETWTEFFTEDIGKWLDAPLSKVGNSFAHSRLGKWAHLDRIADYKGNKFLTELRDMAKINGLPSEILEEALGDVIINTFYNDKDGWREMASSDYWWQLAGVSALMQGAFVAPKLLSKDMRDYNKRISELARVKKESLAAIKDPQLRAMVAKAGAAASITERSGILSSIDWGKRKFTKEDAFNAVKYINAQTEFDIAEGDSAETERLSKYIDMAKYLGDRAYRGADGKEDTGDMVQISDNQGNAYTVLSGDIDSNDPDTMLKAQDPKGKVWDVPMHSVTNITRTSISDAIAETYAMMFNQQANQGELDALQKRISEAVAAGVSTEDVKTILHNNNLEVFEKDDVVKLSDGRLGRVESLNGDHYIVTTVDDSGTPNVERIGINDIQQKPALGNVASKETTTEQPAEVVAEQPAEVAPQPTPVEQAVEAVVAEESRKIDQQIDASVNVADGNIYNCVLDDDSEVVIRNGNVVLTDNGEVDVTKSDLTVVVEYPDGRQRTVSPSMISHISSVENAEQAKENAHAELREVVAQVVEPAMQEEVAPEATPVPEAEAPETIESVETPTPEAPAPVEVDTVASPEVPRTKDGSVDYNAIDDAQLFASLLVEDLGSQEDALEAVKASIDGYSADVAKLAEDIKTEKDITKRVAKTKESATIARRLEILNQVQDILSPKQEVTTPEPVESVAQAPEVTPLTEEATSTKSADPKEAFRERVAEWVNKLGINVRVMESVEDVDLPSAKAVIEEGQRVVGWYNVATGEVCLYMPNIESIADVDSTIVHEVVAHKGISLMLGKDGFNALCDRVWQMMSEDARNAYINYPGVDGDPRKAADEYIAHLAERVDLDANEQTIWQEIINFFREALAKLNINIEITDEVLADLIRASYHNLAAQNLENQGAEVDSARGDVHFAVKDILSGAEREKAIADIMKVTGRDRKTVEKYLEAEQSLAQIILDQDNAAFLDLQVDESVPSIWNNSDYPQGTVEFSNICRKRLPLTMIYQQLQKEFPNTVFDATTLETIRGVLKRNGVDVACGLCFVEDRRQLLGEIGNEFINAVRGEHITTNANQIAALQALKDSGDTYIPNLYELLTLDGMKELRRNHPEVAVAFVRYNNARGMQAGRLFQAYSAYHREILDYSKAKVKSINDNGGLRIFSFSDFEAHHLIDLVQVLTDCAAKGIKVQGYTKVPEFARAVKDTKMKLNRSLIAKGTGVVDENYTPQEGEAVSPNAIGGKRLLLDTVEGIDVNNEDFFDSTSSPSVGNILVGINDEQIRLAMLDPFVDYIIPFHTGIKKETLNQKGIGDWVNYKNDQVEKIVDANGKLKKADSHINIYTDVLSDKIRTERQFVNKYLKVCKERGYVPKFLQFLNKSSKGEFVYTKGYYKFLLDFKMFDKKGYILPQEVISPIFDNDLNQRILEDYVKGEKEAAPNEEVYNEVKETLSLSDVRFRFIGEKGAANLDKAEEATIRLDNLGIARQMESAEKDAKTIKMATGWERGTDGKWRYEVADTITAKTIRGLKGVGLKKIHDARSKYIKNLDKYAYITTVVGIDRLYDAEKINATSWPEAQKKMWLDVYNTYKDNREAAIEDANKARKVIKNLTNLGKGEFMLYEVLGENDSLFKEYPQLRSVRFTIKPYKGSKTLGGYNRLNNTIKVVDFRGLFENDKGEGTASTVAHEIQHIIQSLEGFARGGNALMQDPNKARNKGEIIEKMTKNLDDRESALKTLYNARNEVSDKMRDWYDTHPDASYEDALNDPAMAALDAEFTSLGQAIETAREELTFFAERLASMHETDTTLGDEGYRKLAGEVEARNVERRRQMTPEERLQTLASETADVAKEDQIILEDSLIGASAKDVRFSVKEKDVKNVILQDTENKKLPYSREEAFAYIPQGGVVFNNADTGADIKVSRKAVKHTSLHDKREAYAIFADMKSVIGNAVKIGNIPVAENEVGHTRSVSVMYVPINVNGTQYSARLVVKELENKGKVLEELSLYNVSMHKEKNSAVQPLNASNEVGGITAEPNSYYKVKDLIHNSQKIDKEIVGISDNTRFRITPAMDSAYLDAVNRGDMETAQRMVNEAAEAAGYTTDESWKKNHRAPRKDEENANPFNTEIIVPADYWTHPEWYTQIRHNATDRESYYNLKPAIDKYKRLVAEGKQEEADKVTVTMYRGVDKRANKREASFRNGDWITPSRQYALMSAPYGNARVIEQEVPLKNIWWDGNSINEWGYDDGSEYTYKDTKNNRKLLDAVTYDDNGNVIPLSERFNPRKEDVRYSVKSGLSITEEMQNIIDTAKANGTYLKAPNGADTNLTPRQWVQVRTKAFKEWFGDWEKATRIEKLRASNPIDVVFSEQYELTRKSAKEWMRDNIKGEYVNNDTNEHIVISNVGINEVTSHGSQSSAHLKSLSAIPQMIENSIFIDELPNNKDHDKYDSYRYYVCGLKIDGVDYTAKIVVGVKGDSKYYDHRLTEIEKGSLIDNLNGLSNSVVDNQDSLVSESKDTKLNKLLQINSSKVVDENGEPKIVYHGSNWRNITTFDRKQSKRRPSGLKEYGFYFTSNKELAQVYADVEESKETKEAISVLGTKIDAAYENGQYDRVMDLYEEYSSLTNNLEPHIYEVFLNLRDVVEFNAGKKAENGWYNLTADVGYKTATGRDAIEAYAGGNYMVGNRLRKDGIIARNIIDMFVGTENPAALEPYFDKYGGDVYLVFDANNIKSATDNVGTFDANNPDIRFSIKSTPADAVMDYNRGEYEKLTEEYNDLLQNKEKNPNFDEALNEWRDRKAIVLYDYLNSFAESLGLLDKVILDIFNTRGDKSEYESIVDIWMPGLSNEDRQKAIESLASPDIAGIFVPLSNGILIDVSHTDRAKLKDYEECLMHEFSHYDDAQTKSSEDLLKVYDENEEFILSSKNLSKYVQQGESKEILSTELLSLAMERIYSRDAFTAFMNGSITAEGAVDTLKYSMPLMREILIDKLNRHKEYAEQAAERRGAAEGNEDSYNQSGWNNEDGLYISRKGRRRDIGDEFVEVDIQDLIDKDEPFEIIGSDNVRFALKEGETPIDANDRAIEMERELKEAGVDPEEIKRRVKEATGWERRGKDNFWHYKLPKNPSWRDNVAPIDVVAKDLQEVADAVIAQQRETESKLRFVEKGVVLARERISKLYAELRNTRANINDIAKKIAKEMRDAISTELVEVMGKRDFDNLIRIIEEAVSKGDIEPALRQLGEQLVKLEEASLRKSYNKMMNLKLEGTNPRGVSVSRWVDESSRVAINTYKDCLEKGKSAAVLEAEFREEWQYGKNKKSRDPWAMWTAIDLLQRYESWMSLDEDIAQIDAEIQEKRQENSELFYEGRIASANGDKAEAFACYRQINKNKEEISNLLAERLQKAESRNNAMAYMDRTLDETITMGRSIFAEQRSQREFHKAEIVKMGFEDCIDLKNPTPSQDAERTRMQNFGLALKNFLIAPAYSMNTMLKVISINAPQGEGRLYDYFVRGDRGYMAAMSNFNVGYNEAMKIYADRAKEIFGKDYEKVLSDSDKASNITVKLVNGKNVEEMVLPYGTAMYVYMVDKMTDGRVKLRKMGISEEAIADLISALPNEYIQMADWIQEEYLPMLREKYNETHLECFGIPMAKVDNYVPLKILQSKIYKEVDGSGMEMTTLPTAIVGAIVKRTRNTLPIDLHVNAFEVIREHVENMEHWNAYTFVIQDMNALLSSTEFRRMIEHQHPGLFKRLKEAAQIAAGTYRDEPTAVDKGFGALNKLAASSKIAFRVNTAIKQILSYPAFASYAMSGDFFANLLKNLSPTEWKKNFDWALENVPGFKARWESRTAGNEKLSQATMAEFDKIIKKVNNIGMWPNAFVDALTCANGAKAVYDYRVDFYKERGFEEAEAQRLAKIDAAEAMNATQQSSEGLFISSLQAKRDLFSVAISTFQNSNFAYLRKQFEAVQEFRRDFAAEVDNLAKRYMDNGMSEQEAKELAVKDVRKAKAKAAADLAVFTFVLNVLWWFGNNVWKYAFGDDDDREEVDDEIWKSLAVSSVRNMTIGSMIESIAGGYGASPALFFSDLAQTINEIQYIAENDPKSWNKSAAYIAARIAFTNGVGVDLTTFANIYEGIMGMVRDGYDVEDLMNILNAPQSQARLLASKPKDGETLDEYQKRMAFLYKRIKSQADKKDLSRWERDYIAGQQRKLLVDNDHSWNEYNELNKEVNAIRKKMGVTRSGKLNEDARFEYKHSDPTERAFIDEVRKYVYQINGLQKQLDKSIEFNDAYLQRMLKIQNLRKELVEKYEQYNN